MFIVQQLQILLVSMCYLPLHKFTPVEPLKVLSYTCSPRFYSFSMSRTWLNAQWLGLVSDRSFWTRVLTVLSWRGFIEKEILPLSFYERYYTGTPTQQHLLFPHGSLQLLFIHSLLLVSLFLWFYTHSQNQFVCTFPIRKKKQQIHAVFLCMVQSSVLTDTPKCVCQQVCCSWANGL